MVTQITSCSIFVTKGKVRVGALPDIVVDRDLDQKGSQGGKDRQQDGEGDRK